jgi:hypothetical protein
MQYRPLFALDRNLGQQKVKIKAKATPDWQERGYACSGYAGLS